MSLDLSLEFTWYDTVSGHRLIMGPVGEAAVDWFLKKTGDLQTNLSISDPC